jgi:transmembrane secretion effector
MDSMKHVRLIHLRNGAFSWRLHEDLTHHDIFRIEMLVPSWTQHLLQRERMTKAERETIERAELFHPGQGPLEERIYLCVDRELHGKYRMVTRPSTMPTSPLDLGTPEIQAEG